MTEMNSSLIAIKESIINDEQVQTVNARELHAFLEVRKDFSSWMKDRIEKYNFVENQDFVCSPVLVSEGRGGQNRIDYHITIDMAKELAMVERNAKGKEARQYFIAIEKAYREQQPKELTREQILVMALESERERVRLAAQVEVMTPKAEYYDQLIGSEELSDGEQVAKTLRTSREKLYRFLKDRGVITKSNLPMQLYIDKDLMRVKPTPYTDIFGNPKVSLKIVFTQQGIQYVRSLFNEIMVSVERSIAA